MARDPSQPTEDPIFLAPLQGEANALSLQSETEHFTAADADFEGNELHAAGQTCATCGRTIVAGEDLRRLSTGDYVHEACPYVRP